MSAVVLPLFDRRCAWGSALNTPAWVRLVWRGMRNPTRARPRWIDTLMLGRIAIALTSISLCGATGLEIRDVLRFGVPSSLPIPVWLVPMLPMASADPLFPRVDHPRAREARDRRAGGSTGRAPPPGRPRCSASGQCRRRHAAPPKTEARRD